MRRNIAMYAVLLVVFCLGAMLVSGLFSAPKSEATTAAAECLTAARDLDRGRFLELSDLSWRPCPKGPVASVGRRGSEGLDVHVGAVLRDQVPIGAAVPGDVLIRPSDNDFLAAVLKPGARAMAIRVDDVTGGAGLIRPGNLVDVIVSGKFDGEEGNRSAAAAAKTLLSAVRVLAVNRDIGVGETAKNEPAARSSRETKGTVTLEVSPKEVELLTVAKTMGTLSLSLCSLSPETAGSGQASPGGTRASEIARRETSQGPVAEAKVIVTMFGQEQSRQASR
jgi:pilus assembly protein CpaB